MRWLIFLSRVAFICNICFVIAFSLQLTNWIKNEDLTSMIVMIGYVMGIVLNPFVVICYCAVFGISKLKLKAVPSWLITANILFLVIEVLFIFYLNDTKHT